MVGHFTTPEFHQMKIICKKISSQVEIGAFIFTNFGG